MHFFPKLFLGLSALAFFAIGINTFSDPIAAMAGLNLSPTTVNAMNEIKANYGGFQIAVGIVCLLGVLKQTMVFPALVVSLTVTTGLACGRIISVVSDGVPNELAMGLLVLEIVSTLGALVSSSIYVRYRKRTG